MDTSLFSLSIIVPVMVVVLILLAILCILYIKNKKLKKVLDSEKQKFSVFSEGIKKIKESNNEDPQKSFEVLNKFVRTFFKEYYQLNYSLTYLELEQAFKKRGKEDFARFCKMMSDIDYGGEKNKNNQIKTLINIFSDILEEFEV